MTSKNASFLILLSGVFLITLAHKNLFPQNFERCDLKSTDFGNCFKNAIMHALNQLSDGPIPEAGMPNLNPLHIPSLVIGEGKGAVNVRQNFKNVRLYGLNNVTILEAGIDFEKRIFFIKVRIPLIRKIGEYSLNGRILMLPIVGEGKSNITLVNTFGTTTMTFEIVRKSGRDHMKILDDRTTLDPSRLIYDLENLFNGDATLGANVLKVMNDNWKAVFEDVKTGYEGAFSDIIFAISSAFFDRVPLADVFINYP